MEEYFNNHIKCFFDNDKDKNCSQVDRKLRNDKHNLFNLCPCCHKQIHHGKAADVKEKLDVEKWIMSIYELQREHDKYDRILSK